MNKGKETMLKIVNYTWPFLVLVLIFIFGWSGLKPYLGVLWRKAELVKEYISGEHEEAHVNRDPDAEYDFFTDQLLLYPAKADELGLHESFAGHEDLPEGTKVKNPEELRQAIAGAKPDDKIILLAGEYKMNLEIEKDIYIIGSGAGTVLSAKDESNPVILAKNKSFSVENLVLGEGRVGIEVNGGELTVARVRFTGLKGTACYARGAKLNFLNSWVSGSNSAVKAVNSRGEIADSIIKENEKAGVEFRGSKFKVHGNEITGNGSYGVYADAESKAEVRNNYIAGNEGFNVRIENEKQIYR